MRPATAAIKAQVCLATNPTALLWKLKIAPTTLPIIASSASTAFPASLLTGLASLSSPFFRVPSSFSVEAEPPVPPPPKTPVYASAMVEMVIDRAVKIENIIPCSRKRVQILSDNSVSFSDNSTPSASSFPGNSTPSTSSSTGNSAPSTSSSTSSSAVGSNGAYCGVGVVAVAGLIGICVYFAHNNKKKRQIIHEEPIKPKRRHML